MKNKKLLEILVDSLSYDNNYQELEKYIQENYKKLDKEDLLKTILTLTKKDTLFYVSPCYNWEEIIKNIDDTTWLNDEDNYL